MLRLLSIAALLSVGIVSSAPAATFVFDFGAKDPIESKNTFGSFTLEKNAESYSLTSFSGKVGGTKYTTSQVGLQDFQSLLVIGGTLNSVQRTLPGTNDFSFVIYKNDIYQDIYLTYGAEGFDKLVSIGVGLDKGTLPITSAVPEPASWAMMIGGFGMVGAASRYRRRSAKVSLA